MARSNIAALLVPYPPLLWRILRTTVLLWIAFHVALAMTKIVVPEPIASAAVVVACAVAVWLDLARGDHLFFANLGVSPRWSACVSLLFGGTMEITLQFVLRVGMGIS